MGTKIVELCATAQQQYGDVVKPATDGWDVFGEVLK